MKELIDEQLKFIEFLKRHSIYRTTESTNVMQKMFTVWKETKKEAQKRVDAYRSQW